MILRNQAAATALPFSSESSLLLALSLLPLLPSLSLESWALLPQIRSRIDCGNPFLLLHIIIAPRMQESATFRLLLPLNNNINIYNRMCLNMLFTSMKRLFRLMVSTEWPLLTALLLTTHQIKPCSINNNNNMQSTKARKTFRCKTFLSNLLITTTKAIIMQIISINMLPTRMHSKIMGMIVDMEITMEEAIHTTRYCGQELPSCKLGIIARGQRPITNQQQLNTKCKKQSILHGHHCPYS